MAFTPRVLSASPVLHLADYELSGGGRGLEAAVRLGPAGIVEEITAFTTEISRLRRAIDELDERQRAKQPDWSHDAVDSGKWPATRFTQRSTDAFE